MKIVNKANSLESRVFSSGLLSLLEGVPTEQELKVQRGEGRCLRLHSRSMLMAAGVVRA